MVGIDQQTYSWRLLADLVFRSSPKADIVEGSVCTTTPVATAGVMVPEVDGGVSPNRPAEQTSTKRTGAAAGASAAASTTTSLVFTISAVARSGQRLLFWEVPFDMLRGLLRRFSGHTTIFLRDSISTRQASALFGKSATRAEMCASQPILSWLPLCWLEKWFVRGLTT